MLFFFPHAEVLSWTSSVPDMPGEWSVGFCFLPIREAGEEGLWRAIPFRYIMLEHCVTLFVLVVVSVGPEHSMLRLCGL